MTLRQRLCGFRGHRFQVYALYRSDEDRARGIRSQVRVQCARCRYRSRWIAFQDGADAYGDCLG